MSHEHGRQLVRHRSSSHTGRPPLDRPSLFAGMEDTDGVLAVGAQPVRILSTLESSRRTSANRGRSRDHARAEHASGRQRTTPHAKIHPGPSRAAAQAWQSKVLMGLMLAGVLALLAAFAIIVMEGRASAARLDGVWQDRLAGGQPGWSAASRRVPSQSQLPQALAPMAHADSGNPLAALIATSPASATAPAANTARIENLAPEDDAARRVATAAPPAAVAAGLEPPSHTPFTSPEARAAGITEITRASPRTPGGSADHAHDVRDTREPQKASTRLAAAEITSKPTKAARSSASKRAAAAGPDDDVALLEAMFRHTATRHEPPPSPAEEIARQCGPLSGAEAATCRARICVHNPSAAVCHSDP